VNAQTIDSSLVRRAAIGVRRLCVALAVLALPATTYAEDAPVVGVGDLTFAVADIERAIQHYEKSLGFELLATRPQLVDGELGANEYDALLQALMDVGGAYYRMAWFSVPGSAVRLRLVEVINNQQVFGLRGVRQTSASYTDGGGIAMRLAVPDLAALKDEIDRAYTGDILTTGGAPITAGSARLTVRDDEGVVMELVEPWAPTAGGTDLAIGTSVVLTAANAKEKLEFYQDLGFEFATGDWEASADVLAAVGATGGRVRWHKAQMPGVDVPLVIAEFQGTKQRRFFPTTMGQSGAGWLQFVVRDLEAVVEELRAKRVLIVSTGLQPVQFEDSRRIVVRDPDGLFVELVEREPEEGSE
jgi:catechol 2,3-dioxygenase-like lactoylglutathione lyase family enzyme